MEGINLSNTNRLYTVLLLQSGPRHGYGLIDEIEEITGERPSTAHIYPFLEELERNGLVEAEKEGRRKVYRLTEDGHEVVQEQMESFGEILHAAVEGSVRECVNCGCRIYSDGYEEDGEIYCCRHCASSS
ncbi:MAG: PadR family transcriptional regulator [Candidatus Nanohaloarchaea archaeon]